MIVTYELIIKYNISHLICHATANTAVYLCWFVSWKQIILKNYDSVNISEILRFAFYYWSSFLTPV